MTTWLVFRDEGHFRDAVDTVAVADKLTTDDAHALFTLAVARVRHGEMPQLKAPLRYVVAEPAAVNAVHVRRRHIRIGAV